MDGKGHDLAVRSKVRIKGLFADGAWRCDCNPRLPAERFQTKNGGVNHGRWFYTCQKSSTKRCDFFLWQDEAKPREAAVLFSNSRIENDVSSEKVPNRAPPADEGLVDTSPKTKDAIEASKRIIPAAELSFPETPRKERKLEGQASPGSATTAYTFRSPFTSHDDVFTTPGSRQKSSNFSPSASFTSPKDTPTPTRYRNALTGDAPSFNLSPSHLRFTENKDHDISGEILQRLAGLNVELLTSEVATAIKDVCAFQARKMRGIEKGRDVARTAVRTREARIEALEEKIRELDAERAADRETIESLLSRLEDGP